MCKDWAVASSFFQPTRNGYRLGVHHGTTARTQMALAAIQDFVHRLGAVLRAMCEIGVRKRHGRLGAEKPLAACFQIRSGIPSDFAVHADAVCAGCRLLWCSQVTLRRTGGDASGGSPEIRSEAVSSSLLQPDEAISIGFATMGVRTSISSTRRAP